MWTNDEMTRKIKKKRDEKMKRKMNVFMRHARRRATQVEIEVLEQNTRMWAGGRRVGEGREGGWGVFGAGWCWLVCMSVADWGGMWWGFRESRWLASWCDGDGEAIWRVRRNIGWFVCLFVCDCLLAISI